MKTILMGMMLATSLFAYDACDRYEKRVLDNNKRINLMIMNRSPKVSICTQNMLLKTYVINAYPHCEHRLATKKYMDELLSNIIYKLDDKCKDFNKRMNGGN